MISFNEIPINLRLPGAFIEISNLRANQGLVFEPPRILIFGQKLAAGTAAANTPVRSFGVDHAVALAGAGSILAAMAAAVHRQDPFLEVWLMPLSDNAGGTAAIHTLTLGGAANTAGSIPVYIGATRAGTGPRLSGGRYLIGVAAGDTLAAIATKIADAIDADDHAPVSAAAEAGVVTLTAKHKGELGTQIDIRVGYYPGEDLAMPAGLTYAVANPTPGAGNPDLATAIAALGDVHYHHVVNPYLDGTNLAALEAEALSRWGAMRMKETQVWMAMRGTAAALTTFSSSRNSFLVSTLGGAATPTPPWVMAAEYGAIAAGKLAGTDCNRPIHTLPLLSTLPPVVKDRFDDGVRNQLLHDGISTFKVDANGYMTIEREITMYQVNGLGLPDPSYLNVQVPRTAAFMRETLRTWIMQKFPRHKLADDGTAFAPGQAVVTPSILRGEQLAWARALEEVAVLENVDQFKAELLTVRNEADPDRVDSYIPPNMVNQFRIFAGKIEFIV